MGAGTGREPDGESGWESVMGMVGCLSRRRAFLPPAGARAECGGKAQGAGAVPGGAA
ncbi:hypothetical protein HEK616_18650 [Streptomyces nigrescens]|uniref:Uncharacterized protein n=1 Tax=Streptomyces nigrescens TaxID=1920 RepID=A0ABM7ZPR1_STRNI|nr:hypothetical protein HEK616_18650 [Streptomyces nigrescens]